MDWREHKSGVNTSNSFPSNNFKKYPKYGEEAQIHRKVGSAYFGKAGTETRIDRLKTALIHYNAALLHTCISPDCCPENREETAIIFANRSAVFFELKRYHLAMKDIELALEFGYPSNLKWKVWLRQANILLAWNKFSKVLELIESIRSSLELSGGLTDGASSKLRDLHEAAKQGLEASRLCPVKELDDESARYAKVYNKTPYEENPDFEGASIALKINYEPEAQRYVVTTKDLQLGDVLFNELPYASVLIPEYDRTHCHHCHADMLFSIFP